MSTAAESAGNDPFVGSTPLGPVLGIESSCDETAAAVAVRTPGGPTILSSIVASQHTLHAPFGGVVPEIASRAHVESITPVVRAALRDAGLGVRDLTAVAVGHRPGLIGSLLAGVGAAKALAWALNVPFIGVDHVHAHLYSGLIRTPSDPLPAEPGTKPDPASIFPALGLVVSGGHTSLYLLESWSMLTRLGSTIDDAIGEAYDKAAVILGLPHPGGPNLDRLARAPEADDRAVDLPVSRLSRDSLDFSFSGLKTAVLYAARGVPTSAGAFPASAADLSAQRRADIAASFQRAACAAVTLKLARARDHLIARGREPRTLLCGGGVTANSRLRAELTAFALASGLRLTLPRPEYCVDNAAMIAGLGAELLAAGQRSPLSLSAVPTTAC